MWARYQTGPGASAKDSDLNLVIDGCSVDCAGKIFDSRGITDYRHMRVTDLGIEKKKKVRGTDAEVDKTIAKAGELTA